MRRMASQGVQAFLNLKHIKSFRVPLPSMNLQHDFADLIVRGRKSLVLVEQTREEAQSLFSSLIHRAFRDDL